MDGNQTALKNDSRILFLHHSTGHNIWNGGVPAAFLALNEQNATSYEIVEQAFPKRAPYGWANYPYDYWNIWVNNAGDTPYLEEPTLEMLTRDYDVIIFKHCYPVSEVLADTGTPNIASNRKSLENYKLQYTALKSKMHEFPDTRFIVWTGALLTETADASDCENAARAKAFFDWVRTEWDEPGDNVFIWDFAALEGDGGMYIRDEYISEPGDPHPGPDFSARVAPLFCRRVMDVVQGRGDTGPITGGEA